MNFFIIATFSILSVGIASAQTEPVPIPVAPESTEPKLLPPIEESETEPERIPIAPIPEEQIEQSPLVISNDAQQNASWIVVPIAISIVILIFFMIRRNTKRRIRK